MKVLTLIVHTDVQQPLADLLRTTDQVPGFTFSHVEGHGIEVEKDPFLSAHDKAVGYIPRIRTDILLEDADVEAVLAQLRGEALNLAGHAVYWVTDAARGGRL
ncbi:hypothetical protein Tel_04820 [Candidatus Tenderia electrophaga]|jgi:nitrogen regulatory protein P-II 1|uniref:Uncharacterized protein n=1 Tax=Candidatus Tenderia electrophaga TaxID=1748243 RepID=A0A0S2TBK6_9GAMM|nr:hypothetical protein Tel_04820 [Candidatus Tenderia electrophaga]